MSSEVILKEVLDVEAAKKLDQKIAKFQELSSVINESRLEFGNTTHIEYRNLKNYLSSLDPQLLIVYRYFLLDKISTVQEELSAKVRLELDKISTVQEELSAKVRLEVNNRLGKVENELSHYLKNELSEDTLDMLKYYFDKYKKF